MHCRKLFVKVDIDSVLLLMLKQSIGSSTGTGAQTSLAHAKEKFADPKLGGSAAGGLEPKELPKQLQSVLYKTAANTRAQKQCSKSKTMMHQHHHRNQPNVAAASSTVLHQIH